MSDGAGLGVVDRARAAAARGDWQQAFDLLMESDADGVLAPADLPLLGEVPLDMEVRKDSDAGLPAVLAHPDSPAGQELTQVARNLAGRVSVQALSHLPDQLPVV